MFNLSLLAAGLVQCGKIEEACGVATEALELAAGLKSVRIQSHVTDLRRRLHPYADTAAVCALRSRAGKQTPAYA